MRTLMLRTALLEALQHYDNRKGIFRKIFFDSETIRKLRKLYNEAHTTNVSTLAVLRILFEIKINLNSATESIAIILVNTIFHATPVNSFADLWRPKREISPITKLSFITDGLLEAIFRSNREKPHTLTLIYETIKVGRANETSIRRILALDDPEQILKILIRLQNGQQTSGWAFFDTILAHPHEDLPKNIEFYTYYNSRSLILILSDPHNHIFLSNEFIKIISPVVQIINRSNLLDIKEILKEPHNNLDSIRTYVSNLNTTPGEIRRSETPPKFSKSAFSLFNTEYQRLREKEMDMRKTDEALFPAQTQSTFTFH